VSLQIAATKLEGMTWEIAVMYSLDVADVIDYPSSPEQMEELMMLEDRLKRQHCFTHRSLNGYIIVGEDNGSIAW
jgi:hypothetical protein